MSLINDALKKAQQTQPPSVAPQTLSSLQPAMRPAIPVAGWLIPAVVIFLVVAAVFCIGWAMASRSSGPVAIAPVPANSPVEVAARSTPQPPALTPAPVAVSAVTAPAPAVVPLVPPRLQGIFYSPTKPSAIVDGQTVRVGDPLKQYRVKQITPSAVILLDSQGQTIKLAL